MRARLSYERWVTAIDRRNRLVLWLAAGLSLLSALALTRLRLDMDILSQLPSGSPVFRDYRSFLQSFGAFDSLILLVSGPPERTRRCLFAFDALAVFGCCCGLKPARCQ